MFRLSLVFAMDEAKVKEIIAQNNRDLLGQIKDLVSTSISDLKRSNDSNAAEQLSEIKRLKRDAPPSFKKKSNEEQLKPTNQSWKLSKTLASLLSVRIF